MPASHLQSLPPSTRRTALVISRLMFYLGLMLGMMLGAVAITILFTDAVSFANATELRLSGAAFAALSVMAFGFSALGKSRIEWLKAGR